MLFTFLTANGQHQSLSYLLNFEFEKVRNNNTNNLPLDLYYQNLADVLEVILLEEPEGYSKLKDFEDIRLNKLDNLSKESPWKGFIKAEIQLHWAFVNFKKGNEWSAFWGLRRAYRSIKRNVDKHPDFEPNKKTLGVLNVIFGNVPGKQQWIMNLFGLRGDLFEGIKLLEEISGSYPQFKLESELMLSMVQAYLMEDFGKAITNLSDTSMYTSTPMVSYIKALVNLKAHNAFKARVFLKESSKSVPFYDYLIAETYFQEGLYQEAIEYYQSFLTKFQGASYLKDTYLKLALSHGFSNQIKLYESYLLKCKTEGEEQTEIDKNAVKVLKGLENQNPSSLKIRFAIDGGYYQKADSLINTLETKTLSAYEKLELTYRKARLNHLKGDTVNALKYYRSVIGKAEDISETYYAPNSFLQIGYLMRSQEQFDMAKMYFERVLSFKKHPYKSSLDSKAKIALKNLSLLTGD